MTTTALPPRTANVNRRISAYDGPTDFAGMEKLAVMLSGAKLLPAHLRRSPADVLLYLLAASGLGVTMFSAFQNIYPSRNADSAATDADTTLASTAAFQRALMHRAGYKLHLIKLTHRLCILGLTKPGEEMVTVEYDLADAEQAGLIERNPEWWQRYPEQMLYARATTKLATRYASEVTQGLEGIDEAPQVNWTVPDAATEAAKLAMTPPPAPQPTPAPAAAPVIPAQPQPVDDAEAAHDADVARGDRAVPEDQDTNQVQTTDKPVDKPRQPEVDQDTPQAAETTRSAVDTPVDASKATPAPKATPKPAAKATPAKATGRTRAAKKTTTTPAPAAQTGGLNLGQHAADSAEAKAADLWSRAQSAETAAQVSKFFMEAKNSGLLEVPVEGKTLKMQLMEFARDVQNGIARPAPKTLPTPPAAPITATPEDTTEPQTADLVDPAQPRSHATPDAPETNPADAPTFQLLDGCVCAPAALMESLGEHAPFCPHNPLNSKDDQ